MLEPIECTREAWLKRLAELPPEAEIAPEVSTSGYFAMSVIEEAESETLNKVVTTPLYDPSPAE